MAEGGVAKVGHIPNKIYYLNKKCICIILHCIIQSCKKIADLKKLGGEKKGGC